MPEIHQKGTLRLKNGERISATPEGSLGLLALGDIGLIIWRTEKQKSINISNSFESSNKVT